MIAGRSSFRVRNYRSRDMTYNVNTVEYRCLSSLHYTNYKRLLCEIEVSELLFSVDFDMFGKYLLFQLYCKILFSKHHEKYHAMIVVCSLLILCNLLLLSVLFLWTNSCQNFRHILLSLQFVIQGISFVNVHSYNYRTVPSPIERLKHLTLHPLVDLFIPTPKV